MLNYLWGYMILIGIGFGILTGEVEALSNAAIDSTGEAVTMAITMLGIMSMWTGLIFYFHAFQKIILQKSTSALISLLIY